MGRKNTPVSIGEVNKFAFDDSDRTKGLFTDLHQESKKLEEDLHKMAADNQDGSRFVARVFIGQGVDVVPTAGIQPSWKRGVTISREVVIPVNKGGIGAMLYFGGNTKSRTSSSETIKAEEALLANAMEKPRGSSAPLPDGYVVKVLKRRPSNRDLDDLVELYKGSFTKYITPFTRKSLRKMANGNIVVVARNSKGKIVSVCQAEVAPLWIDGKKFNLVELSDIATHMDFGGMGLAHLCTEMAIKKVRRRVRTIIYAETRANFWATLRLFLGLGFNPVGRLDKHCVMDSKSKTLAQKGELANIVVFHLPG